MSVKKGSPRWELTEAAASGMPAIKWKLKNIERMGAKKKQDQLKKLEDALK